MVSTEISPDVTDDGSMMDLAERDQHQARLKLGLLKTDMKIKLYEKVEQSGTSRGRVASVEFTVYGQDKLGEDIHIMKSRSKWLNE